MGMEIKPIKTRKDYLAALNRLEVIFDAKPGTSEGNELEILGILIHAWEEKHDLFEAADPLEAIRFRMDQLGYKQKDLEKIIGSKSRVSEILNRKRKLNLEMVRLLHEKLNIPLESLIRAY